MDGRKRTSWPRAGGGPTIGLHTRYPHCHTQPQHTETPPTNFNCGAEIIFFRSFSQPPPDYLPHHHNVTRTSTNNYILASQ